MGHACSRSNPLSRPTASGLIDGTPATMQPASQAHERARTCGRQCRAASDAMTISIALKANPVPAICAQARDSSSQAKQLSNMSISDPLFDSGATRISQFQTLHSVTNARRTFTTGRRVSRTAA